MSAKITINGRSISTRDQSQDASKSNYILVRTTGKPLNRVQKEELRILNITIKEFVGNAHEQIYLCLYPGESLTEIRALSFLDYVDVYAQDFVVTDAVQAKAQAQVSISAAGTQYGTEATTSTVNVDVLLHHDVSEPPPELIQEIAKASGVSQSELIIGIGVIRVRVKTEMLEQIAAVDQVRVVHPVKEQSLFNNMARQILNYDTAVKAKDVTYRGKGQIICVADTGFDKGSDSDVHAAFSGRISQLCSWGRKDTDKSDDPDGHGTHVCGSVMGSGQHSEQGLIEGTAPAAMLMVQSTFSGFDGFKRTKLDGIPTDLKTLFSQAYTAGARIHTNSWGTPFKDTQNHYATTAENIDEFVWEHQDMVILFAAGNDGQDSDLDGKVNERSLGAEAAAKNCITVGASENNRPSLQPGVEGRSYTYGSFWPGKFPQNPLKDDHLANNPEGLAAFSSRGPTYEDRLKPDVVAPGTAILSARSRNLKYTGNVKVTGASGDDGYMYLSGTSMATPLVAGCCAIIREALLDNGYKDEQDGVTNPTASLIKALLINGAVPLRGQYMPESIGKEPNPHSGFGRVDLSRSIPKPDDSMSGHGIGVVTEEEEAPVEILVNLPKSSEAPLTFKVTLVYADILGGALSNDLNLTVVASDRERHGNQVNQDFPVGTDEHFDRLNNVEQVVWPGIAVDSVRIIVSPYRLLSLRVPFAYAWTFS